MLHERFHPSVSYYLTTIERTLERTSIHYVSVQPSRRRSGERANARRTILQLPFSYAASDNTSLFYSQLSEAARARGNIAR